MSKKNYELHRCDETSTYHTGKGRSYMVTYRGARIGHLDIHSSGYLDWSYIAGQPRPSTTTQRRLVRSVRNETE